MRNKTPLPMCKAFLTCRHVGDDPNYQDTVIVGISSVFYRHRFPSGGQTGVFARVTSAHGDYQVEVQLRTMDGGFEKGSGVINFAAIARFFLTAASPDRFSLSVESLVRCLDDVLQETGPFRGSGPHAKQNSAADVQSVSYLPARRG